MAFVTGRPASFNLKNRGASTPTVVRSISGAIAAESTTRTVAQFAATLGCKCCGFDSLLIGIELGTGSGGVTIEPLILDASGALWLQQFAGAAPGITLVSAPAVVVTPSMTAGKLYEVPVWGQTVLFRVSAADSNLADLNVIAYPGRARVGFSI
jgi:hypothetical protein